MTIIVRTCDRPELLERCLTSIPLKYPVIVSDDSRDLGARQKNEANCKHLGLHYLGADKSQRLVQTLLAGIPDISLQIAQLLNPAPILFTGGAALNRAILLAATPSFMVLDDDSYFPDPQTANEILQAMYSALTTQSQVKAPWRGDCGSTHPALAGAAMWEHNGDIGDQPMSRHIKVESAKGGIPGPVSSMVGLSGFRLDAKTPFASPTGRGEDAFYSILHYFSYPLCDLNHFKGSDQYRSSVVHHSPDRNAYWPDRVFDTAPGFSLNMVTATVIASQNLHMTVDQANNTALLEDLAQQAIIFAEYAPGVLQSTVATREGCSKADRVLRALADQKAPWSQSDVCWLADEFRRSIIQFIAWRKMVNFCQADPKITDILS